MRSRKSGLVPTMENLEQRLFLDGTVWATVAANGTLNIRGDRLDNCINISQVGGRVTVSSADSTTVVHSSGNFTNVTAVNIRMANGDDNVTLLSNLTLTGKFRFNGGSGANALLAGADSAATGSITIADSAATVANGTVSFGETAAQFATGEIDFAQTNAARAAGTIVIDSLAGTHATFTVTIPHYAGVAATGAVWFSAVPTVGNTVVLNDGVNPAVTFTAVANDAAVVAGTFRIGTTIDTATANFAAAVTAAHALGSGAGYINITAVVPGGSQQVNLTNGVIGTLGNTAIAVTGAAINSRAFAGGENAFAIGDTITVSDGVNAATTFTVVGDAAAHPVLAATEFRIGTTAAEALNGTGGAGGLLQQLNAVAGTLAVTGAYAAPGGVPTLTLTNDVVGSAGNILPSHSGAQWAVTETVLGGNAFAVGDSVTLNDGVDPAVTFTVVATGTHVVGEPTFEIAAGDVATTQAHLITAINGLLPAGTLKITAANVAGVIDLTNIATTDLGSTGNVAITTVGEQWTVTGMAGGADAFSGVAGDTITLNDGVHNVTFTAVAPGVVPTAAQFAVGVTNVATAANFAAAVNAYPDLRISAVPEANGHVELGNNVVGTQGNQAIAITFIGAVHNITDPNAGGDDAGMSGGADIASNLTPGEDFVVRDGAFSVTFVAIAGTARPGSAEFTIGAGSAATAANFIAQINAYNEAGFNLVADTSPSLVGNGSGGTNAIVTLNYNVAGTAGNFVNLTSGSIRGTWTPGVAADLVAAGDTVTLNDGVTTVTFTAVTGTAAANQFQIGATPEVTATNLAAAINGTTGFAVDATVTGADIALVNANFGVAGNQPIVVVSEDITAVDLTGGQSASSISAASFYAFLGTTDGNLLELGTGSTFTGALTILGGGGYDEINVTGVTVSGAANIKGAGGDDAVFVDASTFNSTFVTNLGAGDDTLAIDSDGVGTTFHGQVSLRTGGGADFITDNAATTYAALGKAGRTSIYGVKGQGALFNDHGEELGTVLGLETLEKYVNGF